MASNHLPPVPLVLQPPHKGLFPPGLNKLPPRHIMEADIKYKREEMAKR